MRFFLPFLTIVLLFLKAFHVVEIGWFFVFLPVIICAVFWLVVFVCAVLAEIEENK